MSALHRVLYCSRNRIVGGEDAASHQLRRILAASRRNNASCGITGGLLFSENCFAQVLEGLPEAVEQTFERIQCDERHGEVVMLDSRPIATRDFPDWSMGFAGAREACAALADLGVSTTSLSGALSNPDPQAGGQVLALLRSVVVRETGWLPPPVLSVVSRSAPAIA